MCSAQLVRSRGLSLLLGTDRDENSGSILGSAAAAECSPPLASSLFEIPSLAAFAGSLAHSSRLLLLCPDIRVTASPRKKPHDMACPESNNQGQSKQGQPVSLRLGARPPAQLCGYHQIGNRVTHGLDGTCSCEKLCCIQVMVIVSWRP